MQAAQQTETEGESGPTAEATPVTTDIESDTAGKGPAMAPADFLLSAEAEARAVAKRR